MRRIFPNELFMYLSNYIVFHGEKQGVEHQQNTQFLRSYFVSFNKSIGELRQMQKHFPQPMHKQNLLQKVLEFQDSARCPPDRLPFIERTAPSPRRTSEKQGTQTSLSRFGLPAHPSPGSLLGSEILEHDVAFLIDSAAGGILDLAPAVSSILQNGDHGSIRPWPHSWYPGRSGYSSRRRLQ